MLKWFADRLAQTGKEVRKDERGFTLIELLVVVIIIGILAAIAIPTFLSQREGAEDATAESDLRNIGAAASSFAAENDGVYTDIGITELEQDHNLNLSEDTENADISATGNDDGYEASIESANGQGYVLNSDEGNVRED